MRTFLVSFQYDDNGRVYTTQPMGTSATIEFLVEANNQAMILTEVRELNTQIRRVA